MPSVLTTVYLRITDIVPSYDYDVRDVVCNIYHRNQLVAGVIIDDLEPTYKISLKTEFEKILFELKSLQADEKILGTVSMTYDFLRHAEPEREYFQRIYLSPLGDNQLSVKDWGRDTDQTPFIEIGIEVEKYGPERYQEASRTSRQFASHYKEEASYINKSSRVGDDFRYMATIHPVDSKTTLFRDKGHLSPTRKLYDTGVRVDGTQQTIYRKEQKRARSTRHGSVGRDMFNESIEVRGTRPSKFAKVRSSKSIKVTRDTPQHREQLKVALKRLIGTLDHKNDDLVKDTENRLKILDWLFKNKQQYDSVFGGGGSDISDQQTLVSEVDREYAEIYKLDQDDLYALRQDVDRLREELDQAERDLQIAKETKDRLLRFFGRSSKDDLEILEEEIIEDETGRISSKRLINRYVRRTDKEVQEIRDENQMLYKQLEGVRNEIKYKILGSQSKGIGTTFDELFRGVQMKLNGVIGAKEVQNENFRALNDDYIKEMDRNLDLRKKRVETENEVSTLREFIANDRELKARLEDASLRSRKNPSTPGSTKAEIQKRIGQLNKEKQELERQLNSNYSRIRQLEGRVGEDTRANPLDRLVKRLEDTLRQRNDAQDNIIRSTSSNVHTIELQTEVVGNPRDDKRIEDLLDEIERKEKEINALLDLKEEADRKRRVMKKKNELSYNLSRDISEIEKKVRETESDIEKMKVDARHNRTIDVELANKEAKIHDQDQLIDTLNEEVEKLEQRYEHGPGAGIDEADDDREVDRLRSKLDDLNRRIDSAKRNRDYQKLEQRRRVLKEKEDYIAELQRQTDSSPRRY